MSELTLAWGPCSLLHSLSIDFHADADAVSASQFTCILSVSLSLSMYVCERREQVMLLLLMHLRSFSIPCVSWIASVSLPASGCRLQLASNCEGLISIAFHCQPWGVCWCGLLMLWVGLSHSFIFYSLSLSLTHFFAFICSICEAKHRLNHHLLGASFAFCSIFVTTASASTH